MDSGAWAAVNGALRTEMRMDVLANNLANVNTTGYKESDITFDSYLTHAGPEQFPMPHDSFLGLKGPGDIPFPFSSPATNALPVTYPAAPSTVTKNIQGPLQMTGNPLDVAIEGDGFFVVNTPQGRRYTRDGSFNINEAGELVTKAGFQVLSEGGGPIIPGSDTLGIAQDGTLTSGNKSGNMGRLLRVGLPEQALKRAGQNVFEAPQNQEIPLVDAKGGFHQGYLEGSNANVVRGMTQMIDANRAFESYMKAIQTLDGMDAQVTNQVGRLG
ncbi:MAG: flagellar basal-body rod protein FlgF [Magnetococcales bacterium]|nr:flagellar basal-body rod protein FlgF [Magnetococcales bacterium]